MVQWWQVLQQRQYLSFWQLVQSHFVRFPIEPVKKRRNYIFAIAIQVFIFEEGRFVSNFKLELLLSKWKYNVMRCSLNFTLNIKIILSISYSINPKLKTDFKPALIYNISYTILILCLLQHVLPSSIKSIVSQDDFYISKFASIRIFPLCI